MTSAQEGFRLAVRLHGQGRLSEAIAAYEEVLRQRPDDVAVVANLASALVKAGRVEAGLRRYRQVLDVDNRQPEIWFNYANALQRAGEVRAARAAFERTLEMQPEFFPAALNLANLVRDQGEFETARRLYRQAIELNGEHPKPRVNLARLLRRHGMFDEARAVLQDGLKHRPSSVELLYDLALVEHAADDSDRAFTVGQEILQRQPDFGSIYSLLGLLEYERGNSDGAVRWWDQLVRMQPDNPEPHINLGTLCQKQGRNDEAVAHFQEAVRRSPDDLGASLKLGLFLSTTGHVTEAMQIGRKLTTKFPTRAEGYALIANGFHEQGLCEEARAAFETALEGNPDDTTVISNALFSSLYSDRLSDAEVLAIHRELAGRLHEIAHRDVRVKAEAPDASAPDVSVPERREVSLSAPTARSTAVSKTDGTPKPSGPESGGRRIRVGYLSPDLLMHPVGYFIEPVLQQHDREAFDVFCYSDRAASDALTERVRRLDLTWHDCSTWNDSQLEEQIRRDGLDVLVDLAGHTAKNRAIVLARKPAPVQVTYLGYPGKTERPANDAILADPIVCPPRAAGESTEGIARLPDCFLCYQAQPETPQVAPPPQEKNGFVTFGSFNHLVKLTESTVRLWSEVLKAVTDSRLVLKALPLADEETRSLTRKRFEDMGIDPVRVQTLPPTVPLSAFLAEYDRMDIALDTVPFNGGTTTCDALWMGVPVLTLPGGRFCSRMGRSVLQTAGLEECIARDRTDYVRLAAELADDPERRSRLRSSLREMVRQSPLCDAVSFTKAFEDRLRELVMSSPSHADGGPGT